MAHVHSLHIIFPQRMDAVDNHGYEYGQQPLVDALPYGRAVTGWARRVKDYLYPALAAAGAVQSVNYLRRQGKTQYGLPRRFTSRRYKYRRFNRRYNRRYKPRKRYVRYNRYRRYRRWY